MKFFLDSGKIDEIQLAVDLFNIEGITTNPKLTSVEGARQIMKRFRLPTSIQPDTSNVVEFFKHVKELEEDDMSIIKVPITYPDIIKKLVGMNVKVNCTLCFTLAQVITAVNLRANYISIFLGRMIEQGMEGGKLIRDSMQYIKNCESRSKIISASIRSINHLEISALNDADIVTISPKLLLDAPKHAMTEAGERDFLGK